MIRKLKKFWNKHVRYRGAELTPKGECFRRYCKQVVNDTSFNTISAYEEFIVQIQQMLSIEFGIVFDRKEAAEFILSVYEEIL